VVLSKALIRYLELVWADQAPQEPFPEALRILAVEVALETLPHKTLDGVAPERVVQSVADWDAQAGPAQTPWQATIEEAVQGELPAVDAPLLQSTATEQTKPWLSRVARHILEKSPHTRGDQDARVGRTTSYTWFCGYLLGFVVDGLRPGVTAVAWGAGNVKQALLFRPAMERHRQRVPGKPKGVAMDSAFDHPDVYAYLDREGIEGHITSRNYAKPHDSGFGTDCLVWHPVGGLLSPRHPLANTRQRAFWSSSLRGDRVSAVCAVRPKVKGNPSGSPLTRRIIGVGNRIGNIARRTNTRPLRKPALWKKDGLGWRR